MAEEERLLPEWVRELRPHAIWAVVMIIGATILRWLQQNWAVVIVFLAITAIGVVLSRIDLRAERKKAMDAFRKEHQPEIDRLDDRISEVAKENSKLKAQLADAATESSKLRMQHTKYLMDTCDFVILEWEKLDREYRDSPKRDGAPPTLQKPMSPEWVSSGYTVWPYRLGLLQAYTLALRDNLGAAGLSLDQWKKDKLSIVELLHVLRGYREQVGRGLTADQVVS